MDKNEHLNQNYPEITPATLAQRNPELVDAFSGDLEVEEIKPRTDGNPQSKSIWEVLGVVSASLVISIAGGFAVTWLIHFLPTFFP